MQNDADETYRFVGSDTDFELTDAELTLIEAALHTLVTEFEAIRDSSTSLEHAVADYRVSQLDRLLQKFNDIDDRSNTPVL